MTNPDLVTWVDDVATLLLGELPLQSRDSAIEYVSAYLSDIGGWMPDVQQNALGPGHPANGFTEPQAAATIAANQFGEIYDLNFNVQITLNIQMMAKLGGGLDINGATTALTATVQSFLTDTINNSTLPFRMDLQDSVSAVSGSSEVGGATTTAIRIGIATEADGLLKIVDYKAIALQYARNTYGLDNTWNVKYVYTETTKPLVVTIGKYTSTSYATLDGSTTQIYVFFVSPVTYEIVSGAILG